MNVNVIWRLNIAGWEFRTRFREDCDRGLGSLRGEKFLRGNSGLASERIATSPKPESESRKLISCGNSGLASERIATGKKNGGVFCSPKPWEFRTRFREDCDRGSGLAPRLATAWGGNSGLASERIATYVRTPYFEVRSITTAWEFRTRFREDCDYHEIEHKACCQFMFVGIQDSLQRGLRPLSIIEGVKSKRRWWEFRTRFREDCD